MNIESIKKEFDKRMEELSNLNKKIKSRQDTREQIQKEIIHYERSIRDLEIKLKGTIKKEKGLEKQSKHNEKDISKYKSQVKKILSDLNKLKLLVV